MSESAIDIPEALVRDMHGARNVAVLTGAGVSAESGIPIFRDALTGLWARYNPEDLATPQAFVDHPNVVSRWYDQRRLAVLTCKPNPGHEALVRLQAWVEQAGGWFKLITQNVDELHQRAGSEAVVELHGSILRWRCTATGRELRFDDKAESNSHPIKSPFGEGYLRPSVVWFGEMLPEQALRDAELAAANCDVFIVAGTSGLVEPAASLTRYAHQKGAITIEINPDETRNSSFVTYRIPHPSGVALPALIRRLF